MTPQLLKWPCGRLHPFAGPVTRPGIFDPLALTSRSGADWPALSAVRALGRSLFSVDTASPNTASTSFRVGPVQGHDAGLGRGVVPGRSIQSNRSNCFAFASSMPSTPCVLRHMSTGRLWRSQNKILKSPNTRQGR